MQQQFTIALSNLRFFAGHGVHPGEEKSGNAFEVDLSLEHDVPENGITSLDDTVDYVAVYGIVQEVFEQRRQLLETIAMTIADRVGARFPQLKKMEIRIRKLNPPISAFTGSVGVTYSRSFT